MCQISVVVERNATEEEIQRNVTRLDVTPAGVRLSTLFEEPQDVKNVIIAHIDFLGGKVVLHESSKG